VISPYTEFCEFQLNSRIFSVKVIDFGKRTDYTKFVVHGLHWGDEAGHPDFMEDWCCQSSLNILCA